MELGSEEGRMVKKKSVSLGNGYVSIENGAHFLRGACMGMQPFG
jgi:hypothetical protein